MSMLEGIGDEVVVCAAILFLLLVFYLSWIFIVSDHYIGARVAPVQTNISNIESSSSSSSRVPVQVLEEQQIEDIEEQEIQDSGVDVSVAEENNVNQEESAHSSHSNDQGVLENGDVIRSKRLHFFNTVNQSASNDVRAVNGSATVVPENTTTDNIIQDHSEDDSYEIRLKYLDDTERTVNAIPTDTVADFKRSNFVTEFSNNQTVRLIYHGQVLQDERTLTSYGLSSGCCVHVQVINRINSERRGAINNEAELDLSQFLWPLLGVILGVLWMFHFQYREYFATSSTVALFGLSGLFLTVVWGQYTSRPEQIR